VIVPEDDRIKMALKEIAFCDDLRVKVSNGEIVCIKKQVVQRPEKWGINTQHTILEDITR
jgi:hypothetical protein